MDYQKLSHDLLINMNKLHKCKFHKNINDSIRGEKSILRYLAFNQGENILPGDIATEMNISTARVAKALNTLEEKGLIERCIDTNDRRKILISLTDMGRTKTNEYMEKIRARVISVLKELGEEDAKNYVRILDRLAIILDEKFRDD